MSALSGKEFDANNEQRNLKRAHNNHTTETHSRGMKLLQNNFGVKVLKKFDACKKVQSAARATHPTSNFIIVSAPASGPWPAAVQTFHPQN
jgi:hypothetical protein